MHHDTPSIVDQPTESDRAKLTLETLPPEIKNEIFSHLLLGAKVKYSTNGEWPGNKFKFHTTIMRVSKQMKEDATAYLHSQNEFALISSKFFAFAIDRRRFLPVVATGKAARTLKSPAIEATITHVGGTVCVCCNPQKHKEKDRVTHALFLVADLEHLMRELCLTYHMWPSNPIYIMSDVGVSPVEHIPVNVNTQIKVVWKVNPSHRTQVQDSWQMAVLCLVLDCLFTIARLCLEEGSLAHLEDCVDLIRKLQSNAFRGVGRSLFPAKIKALMSHYLAWLVTHETIRPINESKDLSASMLETAKSWIPADDQDSVWRHLNEDWEFMTKVVEVSFLSGSARNPLTLSFSFRVLLNSDQKTSVAFRHHVPTSKAYSTVPASTIHLYSPSHLVHNSRAGQPSESSQSRKWQHT
jgi:hypothetical protein